jgi:hypothetical protein
MKSTNFSPVLIGIPFTAAMKSINETKPLSLAGE